MGKKSQSTDEAIHLHHTDEDMTVANDLANHGVSRVLTVAKDMYDLGGPMTEFVFMSRVIMAMGVRMSVYSIARDDKANESPAARTRANMAMAMLACLGSSGSKAAADLMLAVRKKNGPISGAELCKMIGQLDL